MFDEELNLRDYLRIIIKWRWLIMAMVAVFAVYATFKALQQPFVYKATARIVIERRTPQVTPFREQSFWNEWDPEYFETQYKIITSRALAKTVMQKLNMLDQTVIAQSGQPQSNQPRWSLRQLFTEIAKLFGKEESPLSEAAQTTSQEEQLITAFLAMIMVSPIKESRLVDVSVIGGNREQTALIVNTLIDAYIEQNLEAKIAASKDAVHWLVEEVEDARKKVAESEAALQSYKEHYKITSFEDRQNIVMQKLSDLSQAANTARIKRVTLEAQYQEVKRYQRKNQQILPQVINNYAVQQMKIRLANLESELAEAERTFRSKHPTVTALQSQINALHARINTEIANIMSSITQEYEVAVAQEQRLALEVEQQKAEALELNEKAITYGILKEEVESNRWIYNTLLQKMKETSITERLETNNIRVVDRATIPNAPIAPKRQRTILVAMIIGLMLGTTLAFFFEYLDNSLKTPEDVTQYLDIPFLGFIPKMAVNRANSEETPYPTEQVVALAPRSIVAEAYRSLRTSVSFSALNEATSALEPGSVLLFTSSEPSEGKSCTVANLGIAMAQSGRKTLIVDCDFRKPVMHKIFNVNPDNGLADAITAAKNQGTKQGSIKRTNIPNLDVIPCGTIPSNPSELLGSPITKMAIDALRERYETILIDSPPVNTVTDPVLLSRIANGVVFVIRAGSTRRDLVQRARDQLRQAGATILGGVLNSVDIKKNKYYYYYAYHYPHYYRAEDEVTAGVPVKTLTSSKLQKLVAPIMNILS